MTDTYSEVTFNSVDIRVNYDDFELLYTVSQKRCHLNHGYNNFVNSWSICKMLSLLQRALIFQQNPY